MDLSKLPRLSNTSPPPPAPLAADASTAPAPSEPPQRVERIVYVERIAAGPEAWISIAIGAIFLILQPRLIQYLASPSTFATKWTFTDNGQPIGYLQSWFFWSDLMVTAFCVVLLIDGLVLAFARGRTLVAISLAFTVAVVLANLAYVVVSISQGRALMSIIAVAYGGYIAIHQWRLLQSMQTRPE